MKYLDQEVATFFEYCDVLKVTKPQIQSENDTNGKYLNINGKEAIDFTRLDYLALGNEECIKNYMLEDINANDISCPASQVILKPDSLDQLEQELSKWHGLSHSILFSNGYSANVNVMQALGMRFSNPHFLAYTRSTGILGETAEIPTVFVIDKDSHYSLLHGVRIACRFSKNCVAYTYNSTDENSILHRLDQVKQKYGDKAIKILVSDSLVSSTGNYIDVKRLYELAVKYDYLLYLDEAHAVGAVGSNGAGVFADQMGKNFDKERLIIMGTLTKSFSQMGGYVSFGSDKLAAMVKALSPQYIFSAPVLPWMAQTISKTLKLFQTDWGAKKRQVLHENAAYLRDKLNEEGFDILNSTSFIVPVLIGDEIQCLDMGDRLLEYGYNVACFRFPAVAKGKAILRLSVCADITKEEIDGLVHSIIKCHELEEANV